MIAATERIVTLAAIAKDAAADYRPVAANATKLKKAAYDAEVAANHAREEWHAAIRALDAALRRLWEADPDAALALALPITVDDLPYGVAFTVLREHFMRQEQAARDAA